MFQGGDAQKFLHELRVYLFEASLYKLVINLNSSIDCGQKETFRKLI